MSTICTSSNYFFILPLKVVLISMAVISTAITMKLSVPVITGFLVSEIPSIWTSLLSWLKPPYLYLLINFIIITIVASTKLQQNASKTLKVSADGLTDYAMYSGSVVFSGNGYSMNETVMTKISEVHPVDSNVFGRVQVPDPLVLEMEKTMIDESVGSRPLSNSLQRKDSVELLFSNEKEKPPVSSRFSHRKTVKANPEAGKVLGVTQPKKQETLERTWKTMTEGRSVPLKRHLKKSDTWTSHVRRNSQEVQNTPPNMRKSETFKERSEGNSSLSPSPVGSRRLRRDPSLSQDELNRRVEAFINKFNEEMRLQRRESLNQYMEMVGRQAH